MSRDRLAEFRGETSNEKQNARLDGYLEPTRLCSKGYTAAQNAADQPLQNNDDGNSFQPSTPFVPACSEVYTSSNAHYDLSHDCERLRLGSIGVFFNEIENIKAITRDVNRNISDVQELHGCAFATTNEEQTVKNAERLETLSRQITTLNNELRRRIQAIELCNAQLLPTHSDIPMRKAQIAAVKKRFVESIQRYQEVERIYQQKYRQRIERQIRIVQPQVTRDDIDRVLEADEIPRIFAQSLMQTSRSGHARTVLNEVNSRHTDIKRIEKTILELHQLFLDMQTTVEQQAHTFQQIDQTVKVVTEDTEKGTGDIAKATVRARTTRAKKRCCCVIVMILLIVLAISLVCFVFFPL